MLVQSCSQSQQSASPFKCPGDGGMGEWKWGYLLFGRGQNAIKFRGARDAADIKTFGDRGEVRGKVFVLGTGDLHGSTN